MRGKYDANAVDKRRQSRSLYGAKRPKKQYIKNQPQMVTDSHRLFNETIWNNMKQPEAT